MNSRKQILINDILTGIALSAAFALIAPAIADAQNLQAVGALAHNGILKPFVEFTSYIAYGTGTVMTVAGIAGCKKHADNPTSNPLAPPLGRLGAGACLLSVPAVAGMLSNTAITSGINNTSSYSGIGGF